MICAQTPKLLAQNKTQGTRLLLSGLWFRGS